MPVELNHTIVHARDSLASARWFADVFARPEPVRFGPFWVVEVDNGVSLDFIDDDRDMPIDPRHFAFLVSESEFDEIWSRVKEREVLFYADPAGTQEGEINHHDGGRGVYFPDLDGHWLEIITRPYGSGE